MIALAENSVTGLSDLADRTNSILSSYIMSLEGVKDLGPEYFSFPSVASAQWHLLHYRMKKKWSPPNESNDKIISDRSVLDVLRYDSEGPREVVWEGVDPFIKMSLFRARDRLQKAIKKYYRFNPARLRMPKGEGFTSATGDCSVLAKLRNEKWDITADCVDLFATVCYNVPSLKAAARKHIGCVSKSETRQLYLSYAHTRDVGYNVFKELLLSEVLNIVPGSRIETVPKELDKFRVISCEPFCNMIVQSVIEEGIRDVILKEFGLDLDKAQDLHRTMISVLQNATIDFSNASNSNWCAWIEWLYPRAIFRQLCEARSPLGLYRLIDGQVREHEWNMIAPMGNGFTFGLMTLTLLTLARELDDGASVFGDDVIIDSDVSAPFIELAGFIGFRTNERKTFTEGNFRESCGGFTYDGKPLSSFEFHWATNAVEAIVNVNKVNYLAFVTGIGALQALATQLDAVTPALCKRLSSNPHGTLFVNEVGDFQIESRFVPIWAKAAERQKRSDPCVQEHFKSVIGTKACKSFMSNLQYKASQIVVYCKLELVAEKYRSVPPKWNVNPFWTGYYLHTGRCLAPTYRPTSKRPLRLKVSLTFEGAEGCSYTPVVKRVSRTRAIWYSMPKQIL